MLYIIGGVTRSGKSYLTRSLVKKYSNPNHQISFFNLDHIMMGLIKGVKDFGCEGETHDREKAKHMWPVVREIIEGIIRDDGITDQSEIQKPTPNPVDYIIEGVIITPAQCAQIRDKFPDHIKACWIGYPTANRDKKYKAIHANKDLPGDWLSHEDDERIYGVIDYGIQFSKELQQECAEHDIPFFDNSHDFEGTLMEAERFLVKSPDVG